MNKHKVTKTRKTTGKKQKECGGTRENTETTHNKLKNVRRKHRKRKHNMT